MKGECENMKSIFITGAASGIGRETALYFSKRGWFVGLFDVNEEMLLKLFNEIEQRNNAFYREMDVTVADSVKQAVCAFTEKTGGKMDVLFNCAGILHMGHFERTHISDHRKIVEVNFLGILNCIDACLEALKNTPDARIINMSSLSSVYGVPELATYSATKFAVCGLTEALNIEFERYDIHVCDVIAPYVKTPMITGAGVKASSVERMGVHLTAEKVAETVWKAAHKKKVHWVVSMLGKMLVFFSWLFPFFKRPLTKFLAFTRPNDN
jgi:short-subunit dehydrogenase